jgi:hypothetical protein
MTKSMTYCSLEEAWGQPYNTNENNDISYSGGTQSSSDLHPVFHTNNDVIKQPAPQQEQNYEMPANTDFSNIFNPSNTDNQSNQVNQVNTDNRGNQANNSNALVRIDDVNKEQLWNEFIKFLEDKKNNTATNQIQENFSSIKSLHNDNTYVDLLILILFGIVIIFIMDSFVRLGKNMKH